MDSRAAAFVHYYAREGYLQHVQSVCNELIKHSSSSSPVLQFWRGYGLLAAGATTEVGWSQDGLRAVEGPSWPAGCQLAMLSTPPALSIAGHT